jgi:hypothetical protein
MGLMLWVAALVQVSPATRKTLWHRVRVGVYAGLASTAAYDVARYGLVSLLDWSFRPFHVWTIFGRLFLGTTAHEHAAFAVGMAYHALNGIGFALAYALVVRQGSLTSGVVWGLFLELAMALLYPSWMRITALGEFVTISVVGHLIYGAVLGTIVARSKLNVWQSGVGNERA